MFKSFEMNLHNDLLRELYMNGIDANDAMTFFTELVTNLQTYEPNFGPHKKNNFKKHSYPFWLVKGFYPDTAVMFRLVLIDKITATMSGHSLPPEDDFRGNMYAKVTKGTFRLPKGTPITTVIFQNVQRKLLENKAESIVLDADLTLKDKIAPTFKAPRCVAPKGMPLLNLKRKGVK